MYFLLSGSQKCFKIIVFYVLDLCSGCHFYSGSMFRMPFMFRIPRPSKRHFFGTYFVLALRRAFLQAPKVWFERQKLELSAQTFVIKRQNFLGKRQKSEMSAKSSSAQLSALISDFSRFWAPNSHTISSAKSAVSKRQKSFNKMFVYLLCKNMFYFCRHDP